MPKAMEIGASSGIGRELAKLLCAKGDIVGVAGRRERLLHQLRAECPDTTFIKQIAVSPWVSTVEFESQYTRYGHGR